MSGPADLLKALGIVGSAKVTPKASATAPAASGVAEGDFASLLDKARRGDISSGIPISVDKEAGVELSADELRALATAADRAEAAGIRTALVMLDGKALVLDVHTRTVRKAVDLSAGPVGGIDGVIRLTSEKPADAQVLAPPSFSTASGNLWSALGRRAS